MNQHTPVKCKKYEFVLKNCINIVNIDVACRDRCICSMVTWLHYSNRNRKINSPTYPIKHWDFSFSFICRWTCMFFLFLVLVYTTCYLICVVYYFSQHYFVFCNKLVAFFLSFSLSLLENSTARVSPNQNTFVVFTFCLWCLLLYFCTLITFNIGYISFGFICDSYISNPKRIEKQQTKAKIFPNHNV